ncbi:MAG: iron ABC transporter permease [Kiritimatiellia bacterium]
MKQYQAVFVALVTALFFIFFFFWPLIWVLRGAVVFDGRFTFAIVREALLNPVYVEGLLNSAAMASLTTLIVVIIGLPLAAFAAYSTFPGKNLFSALILVPMILPPFVGAIGIRQILGQYGMLNAVLVKAGLFDWGGAVDWLGSGRFFAVALTEALHLYPIFYLNAVAALSNVDPSLEEAAASMGLSGFGRFRRVTIPLIAPGIFAGGALVFIWSFTELGTPLIFDFNRLTAVQIFDGLKDIGSNPLPYALVAIMLVAVALIYGAGKLLFRRWQYVALQKGAQSRTPKPLKGLALAAALALFSVVFTLAVLPHIGVILTSITLSWYKTILPSKITFDHYLNALGHGLIVPSIRNSLVYSLLAAAIDVALGFMIAIVVERTKLRWRGWLDAAAMLPLAVPGIVIAFGYIGMSQPGTIFAFLNPANNPTLLLIIAYAVRRLPYVVRAASAGLQQMPVAFEEAGASVGGSPLRVTWKITLPLIGANLLAGGLLAFSFAMLEVSDSLMLAQKQVHYPITKALYELFQLLGDGRYLAAAFGVWAMAFLFVTILGINRLIGRKLGNIFRI